MQNFMLAVLGLALASSAPASERLSLPDQFTIKVWKPTANKPCGKKPGLLTKAGTLTMSLQGAEATHLPQMTPGHSYTLHASIDLVFEKTIASITDTYLYETWPGHGSFKFMFGPFVPGKVDDIVGDIKVDDQSIINLEITGGDAEQRLLVRTGPGQLLELCTEKNARM